MGNAFKIIPHYTYDDWVRWEGKWELIEGVPFAMSPAPMPKHQRIANEISTELTISIRKKNCKACKVYQPIDFKINDETILQPDILIVCDEIKKSFLDFPPTLVVEILSPSTALKDRNSKYNLYEQQGVKYYLIVDTDKEIIEVYELKNGKYELQNVDAANFEFTLDEDCLIQPELQNIWK